MATITVIQSGNKWVLTDVDLSVTVAELKSLIDSVSDITADSQRLVFKGRVLKDDEVLRAVGLADGLSLHVAQGAKGPVAPGAAPAAAAQRPAAPVPPPSAPVPPPAAAASETRKKTDAEVWKEVLTRNGGTSWAGAHLHVVMNDSLAAMVEYMLSSEAQTRCALLRDAPYLQAQLAAFDKYMAVLGPRGRKVYVELAQDPSHLKSLVKRLEEDPRLRGANGLLLHLIGMEGRGGGGGGGADAYSDEEGEEGEEQEGEPPRAAQPAGGGGGGGGGGAGLAALAAQFAAMQGQGGAAPPAAAPPADGAAPVVPPAELYAAGVQTMQDMGFPNADANARALQAVQGDVGAAVEILLRLQF